MRIGISLKILSAIALMAGVMAGLVYYMAAQMRNIDDGYAGLLDRSVIGGMASFRASVAAINESRLMWALAYSHGSLELQDAEAQLDSNEKFFADQMSKVKQALPDQAAKFDEYAQDFAEIAAFRNGIKQDLATPETTPHALTQASQASRKAAKLRGGFKAGNDQLQAFVDKTNHDLSDRAATILSQARLVALTGGGAGFVLALLLVQFAVVRPLRRIARVMEPISKGDLATAVPSRKRKDEVGDMARAVEQFKQNAIAAEKAKQEAIRSERDLVNRSIGNGLKRLADKALNFRIETELPADYEMLRDDFNAAMRQLEQAMKVVSGSVLTLTTGTSEISSASGELARRTESQAANVEQTSAAVTEIAQTVKRTADGALNARSKVAQAEENAKKSREVAAQAIAAMREIDGSSTRITQIISVIDDIAFQTNLLALNAGVEAARAGDAGRGFAVVASEVRALAQRSAEAAREIKQLISSSRSEVDKGVSLVTQTGEGLYAIVGQIGEVSAIMGEIASAAERQATAITEINSAVDMIEQSTQQNAAMVEEADAATRNLADESQSLRELVSGFELNERESFGARAA